MADKFVDRQTPVCADWLNTVDRHVFDLFQQAETPQEARDAIEAVEEAPSTGKGFARVDGGWQTVETLPELQILILYLGAFATAPPGSSFVPGQIYYDTTQKVGKVWDGLQWRFLTELVHGGEYATHITDAVSETAIDITVPDARGNTISADPLGTLYVYLDGRKLIPVDPADSLGEYEFNETTQVVTFPIAVTGVVQIEHYRDITPITVNVANRWPMVLEANGDGLGVGRLWTMEDTAGNPLSISDPANVEIYYDGFQQEPGVDYTVSGSNLTLSFDTAASASFWGMWIDVDGDATT